MNHDVRGSRYGLVAACFLISGFAALLYETVWLRQFSILLGTSEQALAVVLAAYMGGLAVGAFVAGRWVGRIRRPLLTYGLLELGIALSALLVPVGLSFSSRLQMMIFGGNPELPDAGNLAHVAFSLTIASALVIVPTALMGATLPMLARYAVRSDTELGPRIGSLYAINTIGAVAGTLIAAFYCLPNLGLGRTTWIGAAANLVVFVIVLLLVRGRADASIAEGETDLLRSSERSADAAPVAVRRGAKQRKRRGRQREQPNQSAAAVHDTARYRWILLFAAVSGAVSFCYEIVFTRMLGHMLGGSVYAFATMLAGFLLGLAIGGRLAAPLARDRHRAAVAFVYVQSIAAIVTLVAYHAVNAIMGFSWDGTGGATSLSTQVLTSIVVLLPTSICIGMTFPLAIRVYARDEGEAASGSARVYCWNVVGGIAGALATGILILPLLQYHGAVACGMLLSALIAVGTVLVLKLPRVHTAVAAVALVVIVYGFPQPPENVLRISALNGEPTEGDILFNHVGKSATVTVFEDLAGFRFQTNGLPEAMVTHLGVGESFQGTGSWLSALPPLVRPSVKRMLIIGLGGGVAVESIPPSVDAIDVLELEPSVVDANREIASRRERDPLSDPRVKIVINDGRNALLLTDKKYDAIVSQPSHPWTAGASHLYTREFCQLVREHLHPQGVFLQWMNLEFIDVQLARAMVATLLDVFPHVRLYETGPGVFMFVASDQPMTPEAVGDASSPGTSSLVLDEQDRDLYRRLGVVTPTHLFARLRLTESAMREIGRDAPVITDERNLLAMRAPLLLRDNDRAALTSFLDQYLPVVHSAEQLNQLCPTFDQQVYLSSLIRLDRQSWVQESGLPRVTDPVQRALVEAEVQRAAGFSDDWTDNLRRVAESHPESSPLAFQILSFMVLGRVADVGASEQARLRAALSPEHRMLLGLIEQLVAGNLEAARRKDNELANWPIDDTGYDMAVRLRLPWRLESQAGERVMRCQEAIGIIDRAAFFVNATGLAHFRVKAGLSAGRPEVAVATVESLLHSILSESSYGRSGSDRNQPLPPDLRRCYWLLTDPGPFRGPLYGRYSRVLRVMESVLAADSNGDGP